MVADITPPHVKHLYKARSIDKFKEDLDFLLKNYEAISLAQLIELSKSDQKMDKKYFHLSFDDGLSEFYSIVAPILKERSISATVFLNSDFIDNKELFYRFKSSLLYDIIKDKECLEITYKDWVMLDVVAKANNIDFDTYLLEQQPYLTSIQIHELIAQGFTFGAHSIDHPLYKDLTKEQQLIQTTESIEIITTQFNLDYRVFSFPFTDDGVGSTFFKQIENSIDLTFGCAGIKDDSAKNHLQRIPMEQNKAAKDIVKEEYLYYLMKQKVGKHKITRE